MQIRKTRFIAFSPCGTTLAVAQALAVGLGGTVEITDMTLPAARQKGMDVAPDEVAVFAFPVYGGRLPLVANEVLAAVAGQGAPALLVAVYGNRDYDDALLELQREAEARGFVPVAAVAAVAQHSMAPKVGAGRPDAADREALARAGGSVAAMVRNLEAPAAAAFTAPGVFPYSKEPLRIGVPPKAVAACTACGVCVGVCPAGAIAASDPGTADAARCMVCMACVVRCPHQARQPAHSTYEQGVARLEANCAKRREVVLFLGEGPA